jgi:hypothetical protein|uniref:Uncharacterized protein n=1 Tax=viral metagenome TaxID=1070528 RepID=A0A6C0LYG3_9ZZZZ
MNSNFVVLLGIFIFLLYIYFNPKRIYTIENFSQDTMRTNNLFKRNTDLDYMSKNIGIKITDKENINTRNIAPINNNNIIKTKGFPKNVNAEDIGNSNRIPDKISNKKVYKIPLPKFDDLVDNPITFTNKKLKVKKLKVKKLKVKNKRIKNAKTCSFFPSLGSSNNFNCPKEYPVHSGASLGLSGRTVKCNEKEIKMKKAKAVSTVKNGQITGIVVTSKGSNYSSEPSIKIIGKGSGGKAYPILKNGKVHKIVIRSSGSGYTSSPKIKISAPNGMVSCNLCCRSEL